MPPQTDRINKINTILDENSLSFSHHAGVLRAHYLGRNSMLIIPSSQLSDSKVGLKALSSGVGINTDSLNIGRDNIQIPLDSEKVSKFITKQSKNSITNLKNRGLSIDDTVNYIGTMLHEFYGAGSSNAATDDPNIMKKYLSYLDGINEDTPNYSANSDFKALHNIQGNVISDSSMKSLFALGIKKKDFFGDMFSLFTESHPDINTLSPEHKAAASSFIDTSLRLSNIGDHMVERGKSSDMAYAMKLKC